MKVIRDLVQGEQKIKASVVWSEADFEADEALHQSRRAAEKSEQAAAVAAKSTETLAMKIQTARVLGAPSLISVPAPSSPVMASATEVVATQADGMIQKAPWPEVVVEICREEIERLIAESPYSGLASTLFGSGFGNG